MTDAKSDRKRLLHMADAIREAREFAGDSYEDFMASRLRQAATVRTLQVLGDAAKPISDDLKQRWPELPWRKMVATRNLLVHHYFGVDLDIVWTVVHEHLAEIEESLPAMLEAASTPE